MTNIAKFNLKTCAVSAIALILLFSVLSYLMAPETEVFEWSSLNPLEFVEGFVFTLSFGLGLPVWLSAAILVVLSFVVYMTFLCIARKIMR